MSIQIDSTAVSMFLFLIILLLVGLYWLLHGDGFEHPKNKEEADFLLKLGSEPTQRELAKANKRMHKHESQRSKRMG